MLCSLSFPSQHQISRAFNLDKNYSEKMVVVKTCQSYDAVFAFFQLLYAGITIVKNNVSFGASFPLANLQTLAAEIKFMGETLGSTEIVRIFSSNYKFPTIIRMEPKSVSLAEKVTKKKGRTDPASGGMWRLQRLQHRYWKLYYPCA